MAGQGRRRGNLRDLRTRTGVTRRRALRLRARRRRPHVRSRHARSSRAPARRRARRRSLQLPLQREGFQPSGHHAPLEGMHRRSGLACPPRASAADPHSRRTLDGWTGGLDARSGRIFLRRPAAPRLSSSSSRQAGGTSRHAPRENQHAGPMPERHPRRALPARFDGRRRRSSDRAVDDALAGRRRSRLPRPQDFGEIGWGRFG